MGLGPDTRRNTARRSAAPGTSTSGAKFAGKSRAIPPPRKRAPPISTTPSLSAQAQLATAYFNLRAADSLARLLERTVVGIQGNAAGHAEQSQCRLLSVPAAAVSPADLALASAQVENAEAQLINVGVQRAQFEHAIAMLIGRPPAELTVAPRVLSRRHSENSGRRCPRRCWNGGPTSPRRSAPCSSKTR